MAWQLALKAYKAFKGAKKAAGTAKQALGRGDDSSEEDAGDEVAAGPPGPSGPGKRVSDVGPTGGGIIGTLANRLVGDLYGERGNPEFAEGDESSLPYQRAGFFRSMLGDRSNQINQNYALARQAQAIKDRSTMAAESLASVNAMRRAEFDMRRAEFEAQARRQLAADAQQADLAEMQNRLAAEAQMRNQELAARSGENAAQRRFVQQQTGYEDELARQRDARAIAMRTMAGAGYDPTEVEDPIMRSMALTRAREMQDAEEARKASDSVLDEDYRRAAIRQMGRQTLSGGQFSLDPEDPLGIYVSGAPSIGAGGTIIPAGPQAVVNPLFLQGRPSRTIPRPPPSGPATPTNPQGEVSSPQRVKSSAANSDNTVIGDDENGRRIPAGNRMPSGYRRWW